MCGRFVRHSSLRLIEQTFNVDASGFQSAPSYNIAPGQRVLAVVGGDHRRLAELHWGLVPFWAKDKKIGNRLINARAETVAEKPSFRSAFARRRCLVVADGFYEWKGPKGDKQPFYFTLPDGSVFGFAALWEAWKEDNTSSETYRSCAIITTEASQSVGAIHHRMPVILRPDMHDSWLDSSAQGTDGWKHVLAQGHIRQLVHHPVSRKVNATGNNEPGCIVPL